ncbi:leucine-rich repeat domain-containing protein [Sorangium sp. So ce136]|uniref:leucine-rich repeat domain-containing protein n=1 Tax=Sorangium sp. So ce136 TaxID=3133284 RepID=UPI003F10CE40
MSLSSNRISDLSPLSTLSRLTVMDLSYNRISDLSPLAANPDIGREGSVELYGNPIDCASQASNISALEERGADVRLSCR